MISDEDINELMSLYHDRDRFVAKLNEIVRSKDQQVAKMRTKLFEVDGYLRGIGEVTEELKEFLK